jgi:DNA polymerase epsilon subunit 4
MDHMEENEIELETVVIDDTADESLPLSTEKINTINVEETNKVEKIVRIPITRIKHLVKMDPDVNLCSQEALFLITKTTVNF